MSYRKITVAYYLKVEHVSELERTFQFYELRCSYSSSLVIVGASWEPSRRLTNSRIAARFAGKWEQLGVPRLDKMIPFSEAYATSLLVRGRLSLFYVQPLLEVVAV